MDPKFQTSFIPKKPISEPTTSSSISLFLLLSIIVFLISLGIAGYIYLEKKSLVNEITTEQEVIQKNKSSFDSNTIENILKLNSRISVAQALLNNHVSIAPVFDFLSKETLKNVRFKSFVFSNNIKDSSGNSGIGISLSGIAQSWETLAAQANEFGKEITKTTIREPKVSSFNLNPDGTVSFTFTALINPGAISFSNPNK